MTDASHSPFLVGMRGYDRAQVDEFVHSTEERLAAERARAADLSARLDEADRRLRDLQSRLEERESTGDPAVDHERLGRRVSTILRLADEEAAEIRATANAYETATRDAAEEQARTLMAAAERNAARMTAEANARLEATDAEARIRLAQAEDEGQRILAAAHEQARVVEAEWRARHEAAGRELAAVLSRRDAVLEEIERLRQALGGVRSTAGVTVEEAPVAPSNHVVPTPPGPQPAGASAVGYADGG